MLDRISSDQGSNIHALLQHLPPSLLALSHPLKIQPLLLRVDIHPAHRHPLATHIPPLSLHRLPLMHLSLLHPLTWLHPPLLHALPRLNPLSLHPLSLSGHPTDAPLPRHLHRLRLLHHVQKLRILVLVTLLGEVLLRGWSLLLRYDTQSLLIDLRAFL